MKLADWATDAYKVGFYDAVFGSHKGFYLCRYRLEDKKRLYKMGFDEGIKYKVDKIKQGKRPLINGRFL